MLWTKWTGMLSSLSTIHSDWYGGHQFENWFLYERVDFWDVFLENSKAKIMATTVTTEETIELYIR